MQLQRTVNSLVDELVLVEQELQHAETKRKEAEGDLHALLAKRGQKAERLRQKGACLVVPLTFSLLS